MFNWLRNIFRRRDNRKKYDIPLEDIKEINAAFLDEAERVKPRLDNAKNEELIYAFNDVIVGAYNAAIELKMLEREVEYDIKRTEIQARRSILGPWRRSWLWRLLFKPVTNRAQDIIEERAGLDADVVHTAAEKQIREDYEKFQLENADELIVEELIEQAEAKLKEAIKAADEADVREALEEPAAHAEPETASAVPGEQENPPADEKAPEEAPETATKQLEGQMSIGDLPPMQTRRPRPPRSCRHS